MSNTSIILSNGSLSVSVSSDAAGISISSDGASLSIEQAPVEIDFYSKFAGWWVAGADQLSTGDIVNVDENTIKLPADSDLINSCDLCSLNSWFTSGVANNVTKSNIAQYDGNRQYYNSTKDELIIIKEGEHLTAAQEATLTSYISPTIPTAYNANTVSLFARFTNTYTDAEKSKIDNLIRLLDDNGILSKLDLLYVPCVGNDAEALLNWVSESYNLTVQNTDAGVLDYRGLYGQNGYFSTGFNPFLNGVNYTQNDASIIFKLSNDQKAPDTKSLFGVQEPGVSLMLAYFDYDSTGVTLEAFVNSPAENAYRINGAINKTFCLTRTGTTVKAIKQGVVYNNLGGSSTSAMPPNDTLFLTDRNRSGINNIPGINYHQAFAAGAYLTDSEAVLAARIFDNYCDGQLALASEWVDAGDYRYKLSDKFIISRVGDKILWHDYANIYYSEDDGATILNSIAFDQSINGWFTNCYLFDNGKIIFTTSLNKVYKTTSALSLITEITPKDVNGSDYVVHTPANANAPGEYFNLINIVKKTYLSDGREIFVFSPYGNNLRGANPLCLYYSFGDDLKVGYEFGQNQYRTDNGTIQQGTGGTLLGNPLNTNKSRHGHDVQQDPNSLNDFYATFGDLDYAEFYESKHMKFTYDPELDSWSGSVLLEGSRYTRRKGVASQMPGNGYYYWSTDDSTDVDERGLWRCPIDSIGDELTHERFYQQNEATIPLLHFSVNSSLFLFGAGYSKSTIAPSAGTFASTNIIWSSDLVNFNEDKLKIPGSQWGQVIIPITDKKYQINYVNDWAAFKGAQSVIIEFY